MLILITGASGFIGTHLVKALKPLYGSVIAVYREFGDMNEKASWSKLPKADCVVHLVSKIGVPDSWRNPQSYIITNCLCTSHALEYCRAHNSKLIILSSYLYGDHDSTPITEKSEIKANNPYALTKLFSEQLVLLYAEQFKIDVNVLRLFNVYGPHQKNSFIIPKIINGALTNGKICVDDFEPRRDFVYIDDIVNAIIKTVSYTGIARVFNVGSGVSHSVGEIISMVKTIIDKPIIIQNRNIRRVNEIMNCVADIRLAQKELGWSPKVMITDGLSKTIEAAISNCSRRK